MSVENYQSKTELDQSTTEFLEIENQFVAVNPAYFEHYKSLELDVIEQMYLSHPSEDYSLRLRETVTATGTEYTATLKDRGQITPEGLARMEIETPISAQLYDYYKSHGMYPTIKKLRAQPAADVIVDWCEGYDLPVVEIENIATSPEARAFYAAHQTQLVDMSGDSQLSSEQLAHNLSPDLLPPPAEQIDVHEIMAKILLLRSRGVSPIIASISGRSGSGKSTITNQLIDMIQPHISSRRLSTDDYHRGKSWLESTYGAPWTNWDAPEVYDTRLMNADLERLVDGESIDARRFDFGLQETVAEGTIEPSDLVIVEGIYAGSPDLETARHLHVTVPTPLATCVGRRLARDQKEGRLNSSLGNPAAILRYQLETAEPMYRQQAHY